MPTEGLVINFQINAPITGAIIKGKMKTVRNDFDAQFSSFNNSATVMPTSISTPVAAKAYIAVTVAECQNRLSVNVSTKLSNPTHVTSPPRRLKSEKESTI